MPIYKSITDIPFTSDRKNSLCVSSAVLLTNSSNGSDLMFRVKKNKCNMFSFQFMYQHIHLHRHCIHTFIYLVNCFQNYKITVA